MLSTEVRNKYKAVIGLEVHAQLQTKSKIFCADPNSFGAEPNTNISSISLGHPGTLPKLNKEVVNFAISMGLACESSITRENVFDRKNYFYPDLPKGYQITQDKAPICVGGKVWIKPKESLEAKAIILNRIHMEEDAGKSMHLEGKAETAVDHNRAGVPLIEIVTEPCLESSEEAYLFLNEVRRLVRYLEICDGNMEEGSLRCDANISVMPIGTSELGPKAEVKNMNSMRNVHRAIDHEIERQILLVEKGEKVISETRDFDADSGTTSSLRTKEALNDYRYFPDPDLSPLIVDEEWITAVRSKMPALPQELQKQFVKEYDIPLYDAEVLTEDKAFALYFNDLCKEIINFKAASNWMMGPVKSYLNANSISIDNFKIKPKELALLLKMVDENKVSHSAASQKIFPLMAEVEEKNPEIIAREYNLIQDSSSDNIQAMIDEVLAQMQDKVKAYRSGKKGLIGLFMGELMKKSGGKADPQLANKLLKETLEKE